jgi:hypothetical protein
MRISTACLFPFLLSACGGASLATSNGDDGNGGSQPQPGPADAGTNGGGSQTGAPPSGGLSGDASSPPVIDPAQDAAAPPNSSDDGGGSPSQPDAALPSGPDAGSGPPSRNSTCTPLSQQTGTAVNTTHGRLDGTLVYVLPIDGASTCNGDSAHVHLQIEVSGFVYDVAVDIGKSGDEVGWYEETMAVPGGAWAEGWHGSDSLGYSSLSLTSSEFATLDPTTMGSEVATLLANTSVISIFCTGYSPGDNGCHDVHYEDGTSQDGAIVLDPTAATSPVVFFRFTDQSF